VSKQNILTTVIALIPLSYILGNFALNLNIFFIILSGIFLYKKGERLKLHIIDKLIIIFFLYIIFTGIWNILESYYFQKIQNYDFSIIVKSFLFLRYILLYFSIRLIVEKNLINYKVLFYSFGFFSLFVSTDIIFQFFYGKDFFGLTSPFVNKLTGPFHTEAIAGGFIQKFSFFLLFGFMLLTKFNNFKIKISILTILFFITISSIILSGNRMSLFLFLLAISLVFINNKTLKKYTLHILVSIVLMFTIIINVNDSIKNYYHGFYKASKSILGAYSYQILGYENYISYKSKHTYLHEFESGVSTWKLNKYIGGGLKSFRYNCPKRKIESINIRTTCNMHPHNYYLEILTDLGIVGMLFFLSIMILVIKKSYNLLHDERFKYIISPFFYIFVAEIFPIRASGSFFTTNNAIIIFFLLGIIVAFCSKSEKEKLAD
tara:strand:- start:47 stop:1345 length:1299 start_codon:yes stop_codon:yes gene_type:complete